jgi:hypothetical protein
MLPFGCENTVELIQVVIAILVIASVMYKVLGAPQ